MILLHHVLKKRIVILELFKFIVLFHALIVIISKQGLPNGYEMFLLQTFFLEFEEVDDCDDERDQKKDCRDREVVDKVSFLVDEGLIL